MISCSVIRFILQLMNFQSMLRLKLLKMLEELEIILVLFFGVEIIKFIKEYFLGVGEEMTIEIIIKNYLNKLYQQFWLKSILMCLIFLLLLFMGQVMVVLIEEGIFIIGESGLLALYFNPTSLLQVHLIVNLVLNQYQFGKQLSILHHRTQENFKVLSLQLMKDIIANLTLF